VNEKVECPAFPHKADGSHWAGLTKRELFAAMFMQGAASATDATFAGTAEAVFAVRWADTLLAELAKREAVSEGPSP
jgi:hypothetical protein